MSHSDYFSEERKLKEGESYDFRYIKNVILEDQNQYMVFEDHYGIRHFVDYQYYKKYMLAPSSTVRCYIDKINCTGRIFLEPEHPVYKRGEVYEFEALNITDSQDGKVTTVTDCFGNVIKLKTCLELGSEPNHRFTVSGRVEKIKKGIPEIIIECTKG